MDNAEDFASVVPFANVSTNATTAVEPYYGLSFVIPMSIFLIIVMILSVGGNSMVILTIMRHRGMRTRTNMFITNLAVSDILAAIFDMPISLATLIEGDWMFGDRFCQFNGFTMALFLITSIHTLMYISIHKFMSITRPFSRFMTPKRILAMIIFTWFWSIVYAAAAVLGWNESLYKIGATQCGPSIPNTLLKLSHSLVNTVFNFLLPLIIMAICYVLIFREIRSHMARMRETSNMDSQNSLMQQKHIAVTLFMVMTCFLVCLTPYVVYSCSAAFKKDKEGIPPVLNPIAYWCIYAGSAINPIIYAFRSPSFRQGYKEIVCGRQVQYLSGGSFRSTSQRSWSFRSSVKSSSHVAHDHQDGKRQRRIFSAPIRRESDMSWRSLSFGDAGDAISRNVSPCSNGSRKLSDPTDHKRSTRHKANGVKWTMDANNESVKKQFSPIMEANGEEISPAPADQAAENHFSFNDNKNNNAEVPGADMNQASVHSTPERRQNQKDDEQRSDEDAFYDSDVELEHKSIQRARKHRVHKARAKSCMVKNPEKKSAVAANLIDAQLKLVQETEKKCARVKPQRAHSLTDISIAYKSQEDLFPMKLLREPLIDYLDVPKSAKVNSDSVPICTLTVERNLGGHSDSELHKDVNVKANRSPLSQRLTNSFRTLFHRSRDKQLDEDDKNKSSNESII